MSTDHRAVAEEQLASASRAADGSSSQQAAAMAAIGHGLLALLDAVEGLTPTPTSPPDDPFAGGITRDEVIGGGPRRPKPHEDGYLSTSCLHAQQVGLNGWVAEAADLHEHCRGACKHCGAACGCVCHTGGPS